MIDRAFIKAMRWLIDAARPWRVAVLLVLGMMFVWSVYAVL